MTEVPGSAADCDALEQVGETSPIRASEEPAQGNTSVERCGLQASRSAPVLRAKRRPSYLGGFEASRRHAPTLP
jgi:hypothetical protein